jgi:hypothetical protein
MAQSFTCRDAGKRFGMLIMKPLAMTDRWGGRTPSSRGADISEPTDESINYFERTLS